MLELDLLLNTFVEHHYKDLTPEQHKRFEQLLDYPDQVLFEMLMGKTKASDERMADMINSINKSATEKLQSG